MGDQISNISKEATEVTNTTGVMDPILEVEPTDGTAFVIDANVRRGSQAGIPIFADLRDSNDNQLPQDTEIVLQFQGPADADRTSVTEKKENIRAYNTLTIKNQQNEEYIDSVKHVLKGSGLVVEDVDTLYVSIKSSAQIDWSNSRLTISENAVMEVSN